MERFPDRCRLDAVANQPDPEVPVLIYIFGANAPIAESPDMRPGTAPEQGHCRDGIVCENLREAWVEYDPARGGISKALQGGANQIVSEDFGEKYSYLQVRGREQIIGVQTTNVPTPRHV